MLYLNLLLEKAGHTLWQLVPYVVSGVILGEILKFTSWTKLIYRGISKSPLFSVVVAAIVGMVSPLCTYGTIPVVLQLFRVGIHISPLATFLATSSLMNPQLFIITWGGLGPELSFPTRRSSDLLIVRITVGNGSLQDAVVLGH